MTDTTPGAARIGVHMQPDARARVKRRNASETRLKLIGLAAIMVAFGMLALLLSSLISTGWQAFRQTHVTVEVTYSPEFINPDNLARSNYRGLLEATMLDLLPDQTDGRKVAAMLSNGAQFVLRDRIVADPTLLGKTVTLKVPMSDPYDQLAKGLIDRDTPEENRRLKNDEVAAFDSIMAQKRISKPFNVALFSNADSRFPEQAGLKGALWGSFYALLTCFALAFPIGIGAAIYLEEFAPKNRM